MRGREALLRWWNYYGRRITQGERINILDE